MYQAKDFQIEMLETGKIEECYVSHVTDPDNFYIQLSSSTDTLERIATALGSQSKVGEEHVWHLGDPCAAVFDQQWSRGRVTGTPHKKEHLEVTFVDFGNKDYLLKKDVLPLSPEMLTVPVLSHHCCLEGVSCSENFWAPENIAKFEDLAMDKELTVHIVSYDELQDVYHLLLFDENQALINKEFARLSGSAYVENAAILNGLSQERTAAKKAPGVRFSSQSSLPRLEMRVGDKVNISIGYMPSPSEWWCNQMSFSDALKYLTKQMAQTYGSMSPSDCVLNNIQPGMLCAVFNQAENRWERASIEKVMGMSVTVTAVDFGLRDTVPAGMIKELREEFRKLPAQAVLCCLHGVVSESGAWTESASNMFRDLVGDKFFTATVMEKDGDGRLHMNLMDCVTNSNVATTFLGQCQEASRGTPQPVQPTIRKDMPKLPVVSMKTPSKAEVLLSWIKTPGDFYIQIAENLTVLDNITQALETVCNSPQAQPARDVSVGALVAARFSEDREWYRAVVKSTSKQSSVVEFLDFGNMDSVPTDSLQELVQELHSIPAQALRCSLARVRPLNQGSTWSGDAKEFLDKLTEKGAMCTFLGRKGDMYEVDLEVEGKNIAREMIALAVVRGSSPEAASASTSRMQKYQFVEPRGGQTYKGYVAFIQSVESFYVQLADRMDDLEKLMEDLQNFYEAGKGKPIANFVTGLPCAAKYEDDDQWYRAKVRSFTLRDVDIFFVDYGNTQSSPKTSVFQLDPAFVSRMEALALHCQLGVAESRNTEAQVGQFNGFTENEELEVVIKGREGSKLQVDLLKNGVSLTQELRSGHSTKASAEKLVSSYTPGKVSPGQTVSAFVSYIESPARFWVQLAGCDDELTSLMKSLSSHYSPGAEAPLSNPTPGQPCVALYDEDKEWYRALVMSIHGTQIKVQFVDYGNTDLVDRQNMRPISAVFMSSPLLAVECCLDGFQSCSMSDDAVCLMESLMSEQELSVTFKGPKTVSVKAGNVEIAQALWNNGLGTQQRSPMSQASPLQSSAQSNPRGNNPPSGGSPFSTESRSSGSPNSGPFLIFKEAVPPSGSAEAIITHVDEKSGMIYVQLLSSESQLQQLSCKLQSLFSSGGSPLQQASLTKGMACCAKFSMDQCWYRAMVQQVKGAKAGVQFVDYGNSDIVPISNLKSIPAELMVSPKHAFVCKLKGLKSWTAQTYKALCSCGMDEQLNVRFVTSSSPFEIQASVKGQDLLQLMFKSPASSPQSSVDSRSDARDSRNSRQTSHQPSRQNGFAGTGQSYKKHEQQSYGSSRDQRETWDKGAKPRYNAQSASLKSPANERMVQQVFQSQTAPVGEQAVYVSNISADGTFCVQLVSDITAIDDMTSKIENCPSVPHPSPSVGAACGAPYSVDGGWYRGLIQSVSGSCAHVVFVDFGNEETCPLNSLKPLPAHLLTPPLAYLCQVGGLKLTAEQQETFRSASAEKEYSVTFREGTPYDVTVKDEKGTNLIETIFRPTAIPQPQVPSKTVHAIVSHVGQDGHFYLQLDSQLDAIADFREEIQTACGEHSEKIDSVVEGQFCFAKFSEDDAWYRAAVMSVSGEEVTVSFVDYGNEDTLDKSNLLVIPPSIMARPACAFNCKIPSVKKWSEGQKRKFEAMTDGKLMNARFLSSAPPYEVELTLDIGLELEENEEEIVEEEKPANEPSENMEVKKPEETPEESGDTFEDAQEEPAKELEETAEELPGIAQEQTKDTAEFESVEGGAKLESDEAPEHGLQESPESATLVRGPESDKAAVLKYPSQTPPALDACIVSHLNEDGTFYLQLLSEDDSREKLCEKQQDECKSADCKTVVRPSVNLPCCAKFSDDEAWYRAIIEKVDDEMVKVLFVDFGNEDDVKVQDLRELTTESLQVPPLAYKCVLEDCDTQLVSSKLEEATADQTLTVTFSTTEIIPYSVNLQLEDGTDISTLLLKPAEQLSSSLVLAEEVSEAAEHRVDEVCAADRKSVALVQGQRVKVTISDASSPSLFCAQIDDNLTALEDMSDAMFEHYSSLAEEDGTIENISEGQLCACQFGEDGSWYRAVVQSMDSEADTCHLFYVDYGNSDTVPKSSVRELPSEFQALPWQCVSCSLAGVHCQEERSDEVKAAFEEMMSSKLVTAEVLRGDGIATPYLVHIFDQGKSVADSLLGLNLPGVETAEIPAIPSTAQASAAEPDSSSTAEAAKPSYESLLEETVESGLVDKEETEEKETMENFEESEQEFSQHLHKCSAQETIDDLDESEQEFSRQLQACTARMESTMVEEARSARQKGNSTTWEEPSAIVSQEEQGKEEEEEEDDFEDAVEAEQNSAEEDGNVSEEAQVAYGCVSDGLAELEWIDIHVCVAVSASEFWCQLPTARSILSGTTLGIERARASDVVRDVKVGNLYLVCDPPQTNYRGKVLSDCDESGRVLVLKLDYGTEERVSTKCFHPLARHQLELPAQAFCCGLGDREEVSASQEWLDNLITQGEAVDTDLQVKVVGRKANGILLVDLQERPGSSRNLSSQAAYEESEGDIHASSSKPMGYEVSIDTLEISQPVLQSTILGDTMSQYNIEKSEGGENDYMAHSLDDFKDYGVNVAPGGEPDSFYIVKASSQGLLEALADEIEEDIKENVETSPDGESLAVNSPCLVLEESSSKWFRGQVKSTGERLKVLCVDRGVVLEVGKEDVHELPSRLLDTPVQAVLCCLADVVPVEDQWCDAALTLFTDFINSEPLKVTSYGLCPDSSAYKVTLRDESQSDGSLTPSIVGVESSINRTLVELGYADAVPGSALEVGLQVERTINDPDKIEQMETSFTEQSLLRENSLGEESDVEENTEQERDAIKASGDAPSMATESDEESKWTAPADARFDNPNLGEGSTLSDKTDNSSIVTVYTASGEESSREENNSSILTASLSPAASLPEKPGSDSDGSSTVQELEGLVRYVVGAESGEESEETVEEYVSADGLPDIGEVLAEGGVSGEKENAQVFASDTAASAGSADHVVPAVKSSSVNICPGSKPSIDETHAMDPVYIECSYDNPAQGCVVDGDPVSNSPSTPKQGVGFRERSETYQSKDKDGHFLHFSGEGVDTEEDDRGQHFVQYQEEDNNRYVTVEEVLKGIGSLDGPERKDVSEPFEDSSKMLGQPDVSEAEELALKRTVVDTVSHLLDVVSSTVVGEMKNSPEQTDLCMEKTGSEQYMEKMDIGEKMVRTHSNQSETAAGFVLNVAVDTALEGTEVSAQKADQQTGKTDSGDVLIQTDTIKAEEESFRNVREQNMVNTLEAKLGEVENTLQRTHQKGEKVHTLDKVAGQEAGLYEYSGNCPADEMEVFDPVSMQSDDVKIEETTAPKMYESMVEEDARVQPEAESCVDSGMEEAVTPQQPSPAVTDMLPNAATSGKKDEPERVSGLPGFLEVEGVSASVNAVKSETSSVETLIPLQFDKSGGLTDSGFGEMRPLGQEDAGEMTVEKGWIVCQKIADGDVKMPLCQEVSGRPSGNIVILKEKKKEELSEEDEFQDCVDFQVCKESKERLGKGQKEHHLGQARKTDVEGWDEDKKKRQYVEGVSCKILGQQWGPSAQELSKHQLEDSGDQLAPVWVINPMKCPLPSSSSDDSTLEGSVTQTSMPASPSKYTKKTACPLNEPAADQTHPVTSSNKLQPQQEDNWRQSDGQPELTKADLNRILPESPLKPEAEVKSSSSSLSGGGSDSMEELAAQLEIMAVQEMQQHQEEDNKQHEELAQMIDDFGKTIDVEEFPIVADIKGPDFVNPEEKIGEMQHMQDSDTVVSLPSGCQTVSEVDGVIAVPEGNMKSDAVGGGEGWLAVPNTEAEKPSTAPADKATDSASKGVTTSLMTKRPEASITVAEKTKASDSVAERPQSHTAGPHTAAEVPVNQDILAEKPEGALEEKPQHMVKERPQDSVEEKPQDVVERRLQSTMEERPKDLVKEKPQDDVKERQQDTVEERPKDIVKERQDTVEERPKDIVKEKPQDDVKERQQDTVEERPKDIVKEKPQDDVKERQDTVEERPKDIVKEKPQDDVKERQQDTVEERPKDIVKEKPQDDVKERQQDTVEERPKDIVKEKPQDDVKERQQDTVEERPKDIVKEKPQDDVKERQDTVEERPKDIVKEKPQDDVKERQQDTVEERPKDIVKEKPQDDVKERQDTVEERPKDIVKEKPQDDVKERQDTVEERPKDIVKEKPQDDVKERQQDTVEERPKDIVKEKPQDDVKERQDTVEERPKDIVKEKPQDDVKERQDTVEERPKDIVKEKPQDDVKERQQNTVEERPKDIVKEKPQDDVKERQQDTVEERPKDIVKEKPQDDVKERQQDTVEERPKDIVKEKPQDDVKERQQDTVEERPKDIVKEKPQDDVKETQQDTVEERPKDIVKEKPQDDVKDRQQNTVEERPKDIVKEKPQDDVKETQQDTVEERPKDIVKEKPQDDVKERQDTVEERPKDIVKEKPQDDVKERQQDTVEERPKDIVKEKPQDDVKDRPPYTVEGRPKDIVKEKPQDDVKDRPPYTVEGRQGTVEEKPQDAVEEKPQDAVKEKHQNAVKEKPQDAVEERLQNNDTVTDIPEDILTDIPEDIVTDIPEDILTDIPEDIPEDIVTDIPEDTVTDIPEDILTDIPEDILTDIPEDTVTDIPEDIPEDIVTDIPEDILTDIPEDILTNIPEDIVTDIPEDIVTDIPEDIVTDIPEDILTDIPEDIVTDIPEDIVTDIPEDILTNIPEDTVTDIPEDILTDIPEDIVTDIPEDIVTDIPEDTVTDIPEDIVTDIPEDIVTDIPEDIATEDIVTDIPEDIVTDIPEDIATEDIVTDIPEDIATEDIVTDIPEDIATEDIVTDIPEDIVTDIPEDTVTDIPEDIATEDILTDIPEDTVTDIPEDIPEDIVTDIPEDILTDIPEDIVTDIPEDTVTNIPEDIPEDIVSDTLEDIVSNILEIVSNMLEDTVTDIPEDTVTDIPEDTVTDSPENNDSVTNTPEDMAACSPEVTRTMTDTREDSDGAIMTGDYDKGDTQAELSGAGDTTAEITENDVSMAELMAAEETEEMSGAGEAMAEIRVNEAIPELMEAVLAELGGGEAMAEIAEADDFTAIATDVGYGISETTSGLVSNFPKIDYTLEEKVESFKISEDGQKSGGLTGEESQSKDRSSGSAVLIREKRAIQRPPKF